MVYLQNLLDQNVEVSKGILMFHREMETKREKEYYAAIKIQSWFRGIQVRSQFRHFHELATLIQRTYRAYIARKIYREKLNNEMNRLRKSYYDKVATKIQSRWRGYYVRRYKFNYYARKHYLIALSLKNEDVLKKLEEVKIKNEEENQRKIHEENLATDIYNNRKNHYLLSTLVSRGIYNSPTRSYPEKEKRLRENKPFSKREREAFRKSKEQAMLQTATGIPKDANNNINNGSIFNHSSVKSLPPVTRNKIQGPFRDILEVRTQRFKDFQPTLRVDTDYESLEKARKKLHDMEWRNEVVEQRLLPFSKHKEKYIPSLHSSSPSGRLKYGTEHFREPRPLDSTIHKKDFQRVVSPIPVFDQLGKTY